MCAGGPGRVHGVDMMCLALGGAGMVNEILVWPFLYLGYLVTTHGQCDCRDLFTLHQCGKLQKLSRRDYLP